METPIADPFIKGHIVSPRLSSCGGMLFLEYLHHTKASSYRPNHELLAFLKDIDYADSTCSGVSRAPLSTRLVGIIRESA
jgi:hypothetical protein